jgi:glucose uptake protein GlcU
MDAGPTAKHATGFKMREYLCMAFGFYLGGIAVNWRSFKGATVKNIFHGMIGGLMFPVTALVLIFTDIGRDE